MSPFAADLHVALVHVGVEIAVAQGVATGTAAAPASPSAARSWPGGVDARRCRRARMPSAQSSGHHAAAREVPDGSRHVKAFVLFGVGGEFGGGGAFQPQVQFAHHHAFEVGDDLRRAQAAGRRASSTSISRGGEIEGVDVAAEGALDAGAQDLDRHRLAGRRPDAPGAPARSRRRRPVRRSSEKTSIDRHAQLALAPRLGGLDREGRQLVLQVRAAGRPVPRPPRRGGWRGSGRT